MKDRNGKDVMVGSLVRVRSEGVGGGLAHVRRIEGSECRVDDGPPELRDELFLADKNKWTWSAWCKAAEIELLG